jgi:sugar/nucleoside kinase (ribokinase family)
MPFGVQRELLDAFRGHQRAFVSIDPHRPVTEDALPEWRELLADADAFFPSEDELLLDGARQNPHAALPRLVSGRLRFVVFKRGASGGIFYDAQRERFHTW